MNSRCYRLHCQARPLLLSSKRMINNYHKFILHQPLSPALPTGVPDPLPCEKESGMAKWRRKFLQTVSKPGYQALFCNEGTSMRTLTHNSEQQSYKSNITFHSQLAQYILFLTGLSQPITPFSLFVIPSSNSFFFFYSITIRVFNVLKIQNPSFLTIIIKKKVFLKNDLSCHLIKM